MEASELRRAYLDFFASKGALILPSDSLVTEDPTLLFTVAGMVPFKAYFEDRVTPPRTSIATSQKCLRTKDIDDIGDISVEPGLGSIGPRVRISGLRWPLSEQYEVR